jgi:hypothetical protein
MARSGDSKAALTDIALRGGAALARRALGKRLASGRSPKQVAEILEGRGLGKAVATATLHRLGIPSVPRALLVGSVLLVNALVQRNARRRQRRAEAKKAEET